ncbi:hypothetical protein RHO08_04950 [Pasteurella multocida]|uniref:hypothetical protein n=1 Tax=Pasteurella multocida TaxID=747 RepID=UPI002877F6AF|nr:hypothetical protein [Pasteurella multocida]WND44949.1 hypothetical protein RHO08_04950 [Pasteurella multocida]
MTLPTATEITNAYLYKNKLTPKEEERVDSIQILEKEDEPFEVNKNEFMNSKTGPGRFVTAADFRVIHLFFEPYLNNLHLQSPHSLENLAPGEYTKT